MWSMVPDGDGPSPEGRGGRPLPQWPVRRGRSRRVTQNEEGAEAGDHGARSECEGPEDDAGTRGTQKARREDASERRRS